MWKSDVETFEHLYSMPLRREWRLGLYVALHICISLGLLYLRHSHGELTRWNDRKVIVLDTGSGPLEFLSISLQAQVPTRQ